MSNIKPNLEKLIGAFTQIATKQQNTNIQDIKDALINSISSIPTGPNMNASQDNQFSNIMNTYLNNLYNSFVCTCKNKEPDKFEEGDPIKFEN